MAREFKPALVFNARHGAAAGVVFHTKSAYISLDPHTGAGGWLFTVNDIDELIEWLGEVRDKLKAETRGQSRVGRMNRP